MNKILAIFIIILSTNSANAASVRITSINDISLNSWNSNDSAVSLNMDMCVYSGSNIPAGSYTVNISSTGGYVVKNGLNQIPYTLFWEDSGNGNLGNNGGVQLSNNVTLAGRMNANTSSQTCFLSGATARLYLKITKPAMEAALAGTYTGVVTIVVSVN